MRLVIFYTDGETETFQDQEAMWVNDEIFNSQSNGYSITDYVEFEDGSSLAFNLNKIKKISLVK